MTQTIHLRWGLRGDVPAWVAISDASFNGGWTEADFLRCLRQRNCIAFSAEVGEEVVGFAVYELHPDHLELLDLAVRSDVRRRGVGAALVAKLRYKLCSHRRSALACTVRESNTAAQVFFRACGLMAVGIDRAAYDEEPGYKLEYRPDAEERAALGFGPPRVNRIAGYGV